MSNKKDHTVTITIAVLIGIVLTVTIGIFAIVYSNNKNIERDMFYAQHCSGVTKTTNSAYETPMVSYTCGKN